MGKTFTWNPTLLHLLCGGALLNGALLCPAVAVEEEPYEPPAPRVKPLPPEKA